jgi:hypothetical protein
MDGGTEPESWTVRHFSQSNPKGPGQGNVPALLRRLAETIEQLGAISVQDITFGTEITAGGQWHHMTVYFNSSTTTMGPECDKHQLARLRKRPTSG